MPKTPEHLAGELEAINSLLELAKEREDEDPDLADAAADFARRWQRCVRDDTPLGLEDEVRGHARELADDFKRVLGAIEDFADRLTDLERAVENAVSPGVRLTSAATMNLVDRCRWLRWDIGEPNAGDLARAERDAATAGHHALSFDVLATMKDEVEELVRMVDVFLPEPPAAAAA